MKIISTSAALLLLAMPAFTACNSPAVGQPEQPNRVDPPPQTTVLATSLMQPAPPAVVPTPVPVQTPPVVAPTAERTPAHRRHTHRPAQRPHRSHAHEVFRSRNNPD